VGSPGAAGGRNAMAEGLRLARKLGTVEMLGALGGQEQEDELSPAI